MTIKEKLKEEIDELNDEVVEEIFDFVRFVEIERTRGGFVKSAQNLSGQAFAKVWDNKEDSVYDIL